MVPSDEGSGEFARQATALGLVTRLLPVRTAMESHLDEGAWGLIDGVPVGIRRSFADDPPRDEVHVAIWPPLDLGLCVRPQGLVERWLVELVGVEDHETGDPDFDRVFRITAEEASRAQALLDAAVRRRITALASLEGEIEVRDGLVAARGQPGPFGAGVRAAVDVVQALRAAAATVLPAATLETLVPAVRRLAAGYGLASTTTPLAAEGRIGDLAMGLVVRRLHDGARVLEVGCVVDPGIRYELEVLPREARVEVPPPDLLEPPPALGRHWVPDALADFVVNASPDIGRRIAELLTPDVIVAINRLQGEVDVVLQHGVLTLRRRVDELDPDALEDLFDRAVAGARTIVPAVAGGYRGGRS